MKRKKEKMQILKVRPFNMANFSGGSGYLVFSLIYQAIAILPATLIIWFCTLFKLPKNEGGEINEQKAAKRYNAVMIPFSIIFVTASLVMAIYFTYGYGSLLTYAVEIAFVGIVPSICVFFIMRFWYRRIADGRASTASGILISIITIAVVFALIFAVTGIMDTIITEIDLQRTYENDY